MKVTQQLIMGDGSYRLGSASVPVDRFTRFLIRDLTVIIGIDKGHAILNARLFCHRWLLRRMQRRPIQLVYDINIGNGWEHLTVPVAVAV